MVVIFKHVNLEDRSRQFYDNSDDGVDEDSSPNTQTAEDSNEGDDKQEQARHDDFDKSHQSRGGPSYSSWIYKVQRKIPRLYFFFTELVAPLFVLIGMAFLFGWGLAKFERVGEIASNDAVVGDALFLYILSSYQYLLQHINKGESAVACAAEAASYFDSNQTALPEPANATLLLDPSNNPTANQSQYIYDCASAKGEELYPVPEPIQFLAGAGIELTFDWMNCPTSIDDDGDELSHAINLTPEVFEAFGLNPEDNHDREYLAYINHFIHDMNVLIQNSGFTQDEVFSDIGLILDFSTQATGSRGCEVHVAGGALFWFTIMTTIGYGNTAPTTQGGRILVFTCGFLTIIGFVALNNTAASVWENLVDDLFLRLKWKRLVRGPLSVLLWMCITILWMLFLALGFQSYQRERKGTALPLNDAYWFSYITTTTVGFGDIHISHSEFTVPDMFFFPFLVLLGFNFLGIFADKCIYLYNDWFPAKAGFADILAEQRGDAHLIRDRSMIGDISKSRQGRARHRNRSKHFDVSRQSNESGDFDRPRQLRVRSVRFEGDRDQTVQAAQAETHGARSDRFEAVADC